MIQESSLRATIGRMEMRATAQQIDAISRRYAEIYGFERSTDWLVLKLQEEVGELVQAYLAKTGRQRDKGHSPEEIDRRYALELADAVGMLLALAEATGVDIERAIDDKWLVWDRRVSQRAGEADAPEAE
ncbi:pyrophosphatase [Agrococcus sp. KRD186]|uniref:pyrophosphatase n=1 Tax=Agrococcus sp. KRD186 TaxID=2729730 RepID=UPI0019D273EB|nr:pyrophosphatase [Agrococcus sp. KRD186]